MHTTATQRVAGIVRTELADHGITQAEVAAALGVSQQAVSRRLRGQVSFNVTELHVVASLIGVEAASLLNPIAA